MENDDPATREGRMIRLVVSPVSDFFAPSDPRTAGESAELEAAVEHELPGSLRPAPAEGGKGGAVQMVVDLAGAGVFKALSAAFGTWIAQRPKHRRVEGVVEVTGPNGTKRVSVSFDGDNVDVGTIVTEALKAEG